MKKLLAGSFVSAALLFLISYLIYLAYNGDGITQLFLRVFVMGILSSIFIFCVEILTERN